MKDGFLQQRRIDLIRKRSYEVWKQKEGKILLAVVSSSGVHDSGPGINFHKATAMLPTVAVAQTAVILILWV